MNNVNLKIDGIDVSVPENTTILEAAKSININIPTLCHYPAVESTGSCRICVCEVKGRKNYVASCITKVAEGMEVITSSPAVRQARKINLELILSTHDRRCLTCVRSGNCELQTLSRELQVDDMPYDSEPIKEIDDLSPSIVRDPNKCILCRRCIAVCNKVQKIGVIGASGRGFHTKVGPVFDMSMNEIPCIYCGQCILACPVAALREKDDTDRVYEALSDPDLHVVVQTAPAVRAALGEMFDMPMGTNVTGKMVNSLKRLGFDKVFDVNFGADLTIIEEAHELIARIKGNKDLPMITSCSPGWVKFCEHYYPGFINNLSTCKSPHEMLGAMIKTYYAEKMDIDPSKIVVVSVMPCISKKFEIGRPELNTDNYHHMEMPKYNRLLDVESTNITYRDVDFSITTRELGNMIKQAGINFKELEDMQFDSLLGESTGAGTIFGVTGGVMEAALRTAYEILTKKELTKIEFCQVRGLKGVKEASIDFDGTVINVAVAHGTANARKVLEDVEKGRKNYHFIEIMACPGGCVTGGGQPIVPARVRQFVDPRAKRAEALYAADANMPRRKSHENKEVQDLYRDFLGAPNSHKAHELLHTTYTPRSRYTR